MWLDDVIPHQTIRSVWGNSIRNRVVQTFDTIAERDAHTAGLPDGAVATVTAEKVDFVLVGGAWWVLDMDYRSYPAQWWWDSLGGAGVPVLAGADVVWKNQMGTIHALGTMSYTVQSASTRIGVVYIRAPVGSNKVGMMGAAKVHHTGLGLTYGGVASYAGSPAGSAFSAVLVQSGGNGVPPTPVVPGGANPGGAAGQLDAYINLTYISSPAIYQHQN